MKWTCGVAALAILVAANTLRADLKWALRDIEINAQISDERAVAKYRFVNAGNRPIQFRSVTPGCDCTTAKLDKTSYQPGESGILVASLDLHGRQGLQEKAILVETDDPAESTVRLILRVHIPTLATFSPRYAFWDLNADPKPKTLALQLDPSATVTADGTPVKVVGVTSSDTSVVAELKEIELGRKYEITVRPTSTTRPVRANIQLRTDPPAERLSQYQAYVRIGPPAAPTISYAPATRPSVAPVHPTTSPTVRPAAAVR